MTRPLEDIRVLALEQYGAGPFGTVHLADLGAEIIKIEDPHTGGDVGRYVPPFQDDEDSLFFETFNRNKRSIELDMRSSTGREVFEDLVRVSDVVYSNLRGDVPANLRIRHSDLAPINPQIVCVSVSGFGMTGPRAAQPGYDYILQALTGWMSLTGEPDGPPTKSGLSLVDYSGGLVGAMSMLAAVHAARRDGIGSDCDISLYDVALTMLTYPAAWHLNGGWEPSRLGRSAHPSLVPFQLFQGSDDSWFLVACPKEKFWQRLVEVLDRPELTDDRFHDFEGRSNHRDDLIDLLDNIFTTHPSNHWVDLLETVGIPTGPVLEMSAALSDPHTKARRLIVETEHPRFGTVRQLRSPVQVGDGSDVEYHRGPARGEHTSRVLTNLLGYDSTRISHLAAEGAFGD